MKSVPIQSCVRKRKVYGITNTIISISRVLGIGLAEFQSAFYYVNVQQLSS